VAKNKTARGSSTNTAVRMLTTMSLLLIVRGSAVLHRTGRKDRTGLATAMSLS
jgi:protein tyrosine/serine phosphatase